MTVAAGADTHDRYKYLNADAELSVEVTVFEVYNGIASVKAVSNKYPLVDHLQLGKVNDEWKIINVLYTSLLEADR